MAGNNTQRRNVYRSAAPRSATPRSAGRTTPLQKRTTQNASAEDRIPSRRATDAGGGWYDVPPQPVLTQQRRERSSARRLREKRRREKRTRFFLAVGSLLLLSGIITLLLPDELAQPEQQVTETGQEEREDLHEALLAPLPYGGEMPDDTPPAVDWGAVGPQRQSETYTFTAAPQDPPALPAFGTVTEQWFADAAFLGDSLTVGFIDYDIPVSGALICAYTGASPNQIVNRAVLSHSERGDEVPLDVLAAAQPKKLYVLLGANALRFGDNNEGFLAYYDRMLDELRTALPNTMLFVQSILPVRPEALEESPGLSDAALQSINAALAAQCREKGCYFLDLNAAFRDETGALQSEYAQPDGIHLTPDGYRKWVEYLTQHTPYNRHNPYQPGSEWYLSGDLLSVLSDLP